jgi:hypothetical protein
VPAQSKRPRSCAEGGCTSTIVWMTTRGRNAHQNHPANAASQAAARKCENLHFDPESELLVVLSHVHQNLNPQLNGQVL